MLVFARPFALPIRHREYQEHTSENGFRTMAILWSFETDIHLHSTFLCSFLHAYFYAQSDTKITRKHVTYGHILKCFKDSGQPMLLRNRPWPSLLKVHFLCSFLHFQFAYNVIIAFRSSFNVEAQIKQSNLLVPLFTGAEWLSSKAKYLSY